MSLYSILQYPQCSEHAKWPRSCCEDHQQIWRVYESWRAILDVGSLTWAEFVISWSWVFWLSAKCIKRRTAWKCLQSTWYLFQYLVVGGYKFCKLRAKGKTKNDRIVISRRFWKRKSRDASIYAHACKHRPTTRPNWPTSKLLWPTIFPYQLAPHLFPLRCSLRIPLFLIAFYSMMLMLWRIQLLNT